MKKLLLNLFVITFLTGVSLSASAQVPLCAQDTLDFVWNRATGVAAISLNSTTSAGAAYQYYNAPGAVTISGFEFFAWSSTVPSQNVTCEIKLAGADSLPTGAALASVTVAVDSTFGTGAFSTLSKVATFTSPVTVSAPYCLIITNSSSNSTPLVCTDYTVGDGGGDNLAGANIGGTWLHASDISIGTTPFDADWIITPFVSYDISSTFNVSPKVICPGPTGTVSFSQTPSPFYGDIMYNLAAFLGVETAQYSYSYGDGGTDNYSLSTTHSYTAGGIYPVALLDTFYGWRTSCTLNVPDTVLIGSGSAAASYTSSTTSLTANFTNTSTNGVTYSWNFGDGGTSTMASPSHTYLTPGTYTVCLQTNGTCDTATSCSSVTVTCATPATPSAPSSTSTPCVGSSITYTVPAVPGATSYSWNLPSGWSGSSTTNSITVTVGATGGNISVIASNICGTSSAASATVTTSTAPTAPGSITGTTTPCAGTSNSYTVGAVSGATSYTWTLPSGWSGSSTTNSISATAGNSGGVIMVTATNGCGTSSSSNLTVTAPLSAMANGTNLTCNGDNSGSITVTASNGSPSYSYSTDGSTWSSSASISGLAAGTYTVSTRDQAGCTVTNTVTISEPTAINATTTPTNASSSTAADGSVVVTGTSGGNGGYTYSIDGTTFQSSNAFTGLLTGNYTITVKDANGCTATFTFFVDFNSGFDNLANLQVFDVYPSPATEYVKVEGKLINADDIRIEMLDMIGNIVYSNELKKASQFTENISVTDLASGSYMLKVSSDEGFSMRKVSVKH